eukprot:m.257390 g.257390  ORF g.257390 m.257390 type:complete len:80 (-) comp24797_c0_seq1:402-641(-)
MFHAQLSFVYLPRLSLSITWSLSAVLLSLLPAYRFYGCFVSLPFCLAQLIYFFSLWSQLEVQLYHVHVVPSSHCFHLSF